MISIHLSGGLGNMMFQSAFIESIGKIHNMDVTYKNIGNFNDIKWRTPYSEDYFNIFPNLNWCKNKDEIIYPNILVPYGDLNYDIIDGVTYNGYFQSEKYFNPDFIKWLFYHAPVCMPYTEGITCSIHVRRGDYMDPRNGQICYDMEYYEKAIKIASADNYLIFSDDINWCIDHFKGKEFIFIEGNKDYEDMFMMSQCSYNIIANSSFSWWGAYLGSQKKVIAPALWTPGNIDSSNVIPERWIKL